MVKLTPHRFEEAHDDPAPAPNCWDCGKPRDHRVHTVHVGDVTVILGEPPDGNPYRGRSLIGKERHHALLLFRDARPTAKQYTLWHAPCHGGARRITRAQVDWETSGV